MPKKKEINWKIPRWKGTTPNIEDYVGFVYIIKNIKTHEYYIGQKKYWFKETKPPLKGRKNKRHFKKESDWKEYWGSSKKLNEAVEKSGTQGWTRQILKHCKTLFDLSYTELEWQMKLNVLFDKDSYNEMINVRLKRSRDGREELENN